MSVSLLDKYTPNTAYWTCHYMDTAMQDKTKIWDMLQQSSKQTPETLKNIFSKQ